MTAASAPVPDLGLMGGMFDPVHNGHLNIALAALDRLQLDAMALLPCGNPVHRDNELADAEHRLAMLALAIEGHPGLVVDDRECRAQAPSYALNSLQGIRQEQPGARLYYLMGQDAFNHFHTWYGWQDILALAHIVIAGRPGYAPALADGLRQEYAQRLVPNAGELKGFACGRIFNLDLEPLDISSSLVRSRVSRQERIDDLVPAGVADYIQSHGLYTAESNA